MTIRIALVDDQALVRTGLQMIVESEPDLRVVAEAGDGAAAIAEVRRTRPDVVLMDIQMPGVSGVEATRRILADVEDHPVRILMLTTFEQDDYIFGALQAGASGFLLKNAPAEDLIAAVRTVFAGNALLSPSVTRRVIAEFAQESPALGDLHSLRRLTPKETDVLRLIGTGKSNAEAAKELYVSEGTIKTHVSSILTKLQLRDRVQAVVFAYESGLLHPRRRPS
jgi:DNA-binding NarL/FixJ family response regulator